MPESTGPTWLGFGSTLRNRHFLRLWIAQILSQTIQNAINYGSIVLLANQSNSFTAVGGVVVAFSLPAVIFGIPAGVVVDHFNKRTVLWVSNALRSLGAFGFVISLMIKPDAYVPIYLLTFFISIVGQFFGPAEGAAIPLLVGEADVVPALSLFNITFSISQALGLVIVGPLIVSLMPAVTFHLGMMHLTLSSIQWLFLFIGGMYLICAGMIGLIPSSSFIGIAPPAHMVRSSRGLWHGIVEAALYVKGNRKLLASILQQTLGGVVISIIAVIAPLFAEQFLGLSTSLATVVFVPAGVGLIAGSTLMPRIIHRLGPMQAEALGVIGVSAFTLLITLTHSLAVRLHIPYARPYFVLILLFIFGIGLSLDLIMLPAQSEMQQRAPDWIKGRVLALQMMMLNATSIPFILIIGPVADVAGLPVAIVMLGAAVAVIGLGNISLSEGRAILSVLRKPSTSVPDDSPSPPNAMVAREPDGPRQKTRQTTLEPGNEADETGTPSHPLQLR